MEQGKNANKTRKQEKGIRKYEKNEKYVENTKREIKSESVTLKARQYNTSVVQVGKKNEVT